MNNEHGFRFHASFFMREWAFLWGDCLCISHVSRYSPTLLPVTPVNPLVSEKRFGRNYTSGLSLGVTLSLVYHWCPIWGEQTFIHIFPGKVTQQAIAFLCAWLRRALASVKQQRSKQCSFVSNETKDTQKLRLWIYLGHKDSQSQKGGRSKKVGQILVDFRLLCLIKWWRIKS